MNKFFDFNKIFIFSGILSIILTPLASGVNLEVNATSGCTNWENKLDNDCDGIADQWELAQKYTKVVGGTLIDVSLPGANKDHRDIFVEIDYMSHHIPTVAAMEDAVAKFNAMEIVNPDATIGVRLHYIIDDNIGHVPAPFCIWVFDEFNIIKEMFMGTWTERGGSTSSNVYEAKRDVYRYALFIHTRCGTEDDQKSSGRAEYPGNDLTVSLGHTDWKEYDPISGHATGSDEYKTAAFMHELGHNLNLKHGGSADGPECKPNYISVMNYLYEFDSSNPIDYSHSIIPALNENQLVEANGIGPSFSPWATNLVAWYGHYPPSPTSSHSGYHFWGVYTNSIPRATSFNMYNNDWDTSDTVSSSINNFHYNGQMICGTTPLPGDIDLLNTAYGGKLFGFDDVHQDALTFWGFSGSYGNGTGSPIPFSEGTPKQEVSHATPESKLKLLEALGATPENKLKLQQALSATPENNLISTISTKSSILTNETTNDILKNATLPPCDITTVPGCLDSPCDKEDKVCRIDMGHNFTDLSLLTNDYGNRTQVPRELTSSDVLRKIEAKVLNINAYFQSVNASKFTNGTDVSKLKQNLEYSLVNATDSLYSLINSSADDALFKTLKLRSLVDGTNLSNQILQYPYNIQVLKLIDNLIIALEKRT